MKYCSRFSLFLVLFFASKAYAQTIESPEIWRYHSKINTNPSGSTSGRWGNEDSACAALWPGTWVNPEVDCQGGAAVCWTGSYGKGRVQCSPNPCLDGGQVYEIATGQCIDPPPPPPPTPAECVAEHGPGWLPGTITVGDTTYETCVLGLPNAPEFCDNPIGTVTYNGEETVVCGDDQDECQATGGTWGTWGLAGQEQTGCLPSDIEPPTCSSTGAFVADAETSSFVCESPEPLPEAPDPEEPEPVDTDDDGTPDKDDDDIDGDGIKNGSDSDIDGDGIDNEDDPTPYGESDEEGEGEESEVDGGVDCLVAPRCTGDSLQCAAIYQSWKLRCSGSGYSGQDGAGFGEEAMTARQSAEQEYSDLINDIKGEISSLIDLNLSSGGTIQPVNVTTKWGDVDMSWAKFTAQLSSVGTYILAFAYLAALMIILRR